MKAFPLVLWLLGAPVVARHALGMMHFGWLAGLAYVFVAYLLAQLALIEAVSRPAPAKQEGE